MPPIIRKVCEKCGKNRALKFYRGDRGRICSFCRKRKVSVASREVRLWETYGLTLAEYDAILAEQNGCCYICEKAYRYNLDVDHDHKFAKWAFENIASETCGDKLASMRASIRGLLCKRCNRRMLPAASDNADTLMRAAWYLHHWPARAVTHPDNGVNGRADGDSVRRPRAA